MKRRTRFSTRSHIHMNPPVPLENFSPGGTLQLFLVGDLDMDGWLRSGVKDLSRNSSPVRPTLHTEIGAWGFTGLPWVENSSSSLPNPTLSS